MKSIPESIINRGWVQPSAWRIFFIIALLVGFGERFTAYAIDPTNTFYGGGALNSVTTGYHDTAFGYQSLWLNTTGNQNTAIGTYALEHNTTGNNNTASGDGALYFNTTGNNNTANGVGALLSNTTGNSNTASGYWALVNNTTGSNNTANGERALFKNTTGSNNTAQGLNALNNNTTGFFNTANGGSALIRNTTGRYNTAHGVNALYNNTTGSNNIAVGLSAGANLTTGSSNIDIGHGGVAGESSTTRIGTSQTATFIAGIRGRAAPGGVGVVVDANGKLGTVVSSARFKEGIKPMDKDSAAILEMNPVSFRYKTELDPQGMPQFGLVAEEVEKINPALVAYDEKGKVYTVRYEAVNAMLLNEFLKEHRRVEELETVVVQQQKEFEAKLAQQEKEFRSTAAQQQEEIKALSANLKEQALLIEKVSNQIQMSQSAPRLVANQ